MPDRNCADAVREHPRVFARSLSPTVVAPKRAPPARSVLVYGTMALARGNAIADPLPVDHPVQVENADLALAALEPVRVEAALCGVDVGRATAGTGRSFGQRLDVVPVGGAANLVL